jgi:hypothetical protein
MNQRSRQAEPESRREGDFQHHVHIITLPCAPHHLERETFNTMYMSSLYHVHRITSAGVYLKLQR